MSGGAVLIILVCLTHGYFNHDDYRAVPACGYRAVGFYDDVAACERNAERDGKSYAATMGLHDYRLTVPTHWCPDVTGR